MKPHTHLEIRLASALRSMLNAHDGFIAYGDSKLMILAARKARSTLHYFNHGEHPSRNKQKGTAKCDESS